MENLDYDDMLNKMSLSYFNETLYQKNPEPTYQNQPTYQPTFQPPEEPKPLTREEYIKYVNYRIAERNRIKQEQMQKRKLLISNDFPLKINTSPNSLFRLKM